MPLETPEKYPTTQQMFGHPQGIVQLRNASKVVADLAGSLRSLSYVNISRING